MSKGSQEKNEVMQGYMKALTSGADPELVKEAHDAYLGNKRANVTVPVI